MQKLLTLVFTGQSENKMQRSIHVHWVKDQQVEKGYFIFNYIDRGNIKSSVLNDSKEVAEKVAFLQVLNCCNS